MRCIVLPAGRTVVLPHVEALHDAALCTLLQDKLHMHSSELQVVRVDAGAAKGPSGGPTCGVQTQRVVYVLVRCRGGVKGGFRKQLEKRGREFARARRKGLKSSGDTKEAMSDTIDTHEAAAKPHTVPAPDPAPRAMSSMARKHTPQHSVAVLAAQGVGHVIAHFMQLK